MGSVPRWNAELLTPHAETVVALPTAVRRIARSMARVGRLPLSPIHHFSHTRNA